MNTGQMLLTIGAMILLSTLILRVNSTFSNNTTTVYNSKFGILATSFGNSILEEASDKAFDDATTGNSVSSTNSLTNVIKLGPETGEVYPNFDDIDDYPLSYFDMKTCKVQHRLSPLFLQKQT